MDAAEQSVYRKDKMRFCVFARCLAGNTGWCGCYQLVELLRLY